MWLIDINARSHIGYVGEAGSIPGPRGVAAKGSMVAVSCWKNYFSGDHIVRLFEGNGTAWVCLRTMGGGFGAPGSGFGQLWAPRGLRFTRDGSGVAVVDFSNDRVSLFAVDDGSFLKQLFKGLTGPLDVEECESGWLVAVHTSNTVEFVGDDGAGRSTLGTYGGSGGKFCVPSALALVPGLGLVVREYGFDTSVQVFVSPDMAAMSKMSSTRVAWMCAVYRARPRLEKHPLWKML